MACELQTTNNDSGRCAVNRKMSVLVGMAGHVDIQYMLPCTDLNSTPAELQREQDRSFPIMVMAHNPTTAREWMLHCCIPHHDIVLFLLEEHRRGG